MGLFSVQKQHQWPNIAGPSGLQQHPRLHSKRKAGDSNGRDRLESRPKRNRNGQREESGSSSDVDDIVFDEGGFPELPQPRGGGFQEPRKNIQARQRHENYKAKQNDKVQPNQSKKQRPLAAVGTSRAAGGLSGGSHTAQAADFHVFVCNTHHTTTEDIVRMALEQCSAEDGQEAVIPKKITRLSKEGMYRVSWRVTVTHKHKDRALSAACWPEGWGVRKFNGFIREDRIQSAAPFIPHIATNSPAASPAPAVTPTLGVTPAHNAVPPIGATAVTGQPDKTVTGQPVQSTSQTVTGPLGQSTIQTSHSVQITGQ